MNICYVLIDYSYTETPYLIEVFTGHSYSAPSTKPVNIKFRGMTGSSWTPFIHLPGYFGRGS